ncbi:MAG TPA: cytochrome c peroxidase [Fibrobacteria bacterium]|nr:cytochrome c peroxidase [Fibrobacteria bacterium]
MKNLIRIYAVLATAYALQNCAREIKVDPLPLRAGLWMLGIDSLDARLARLETACRGGGPDSQAQAAFHAARRAYKNIEFLFEYAFPRSANRLNGPPVDEVERDDEFTLIPAAGFQVLEESLFPLRRQNADEQALLVTAMRKVVADVRMAPHFEPVGTSLYRRPLAWTDSCVLDAIRLELYRLGSLGITGFDSPIAKASLPETRASLAALDAYLAQAFPEPKGSRAVSLKALRTALKTAGDAVAPEAHAALSATAAGADFDDFDRLRFLRDFLDPAYARLREFQEAAGVPLPGDRAFSPAAGSMFAAAWDPAHFGPPFSQDLPDAKAAAQVALGRRLFSDPGLSGDGTRSCATCHHPDQAFTDGLPHSPALPGHPPIVRNAPTLLLAAFQEGVFWDLRAESLEDQIDAVVHNPAEMGGSMDAIADALARDSAYAAAFRRAFASDPDPGADRDMPVTPLRVRRALAVYIRSLSPLDSPWDRYMRGDDKALDAEARRGFNVFAGKAKCATCHFLPLFNGTRPPLFLQTDLEVLGVPAGADRAHPVLDPDPGRMAVDKVPQSRGAFRTPTVRNAAFTAPYMHNGAFATLEDVVEFYDLGGGQGRGLNVPNQTLPADSLKLGEADKKALIAFIHALGDTAGTTASAAPPAKYSKY